MMAVLRIAFTWLLIFSSSVAMAKECSNEISCEFRIDSQWNLIHVEGGEQIGVAGKGVNNTSMQGAYVMLRSGKYYLVKESDSADKSFVIVPIIKSNKQVLFDRVIYFSIEMQESSKRGYEVWSGDELSLGEPRELSKFSWSVASEWQNGFEPSKSPSHNGKAPDGFRIAELTIHNANGRAIGGRTYVYPSKLGATPESLVCFESCPAKSVNFSGSLRGGIGGYPIEMSIAENGSLIRGTYRYQSKGADLNLIGRSVGGKIDLDEYVDSSQKKLSGKFSVVGQGSHFEGIWISQPQGRRLPFFVVPDGI